MFLFRNFGRVKKFVNSKKSATFAAVFPMRGDAQIT